MNTQAGGPGSAVRLYRRNSELEPYAGPRSGAGAAVAAAVATARQVAGASTAAVAATELWPPVQAVADPLQGLSAGRQEPRNDQTLRGPVSVQVASRGVR